MFGYTGFAISNLMHLSVRQADCKNHSSESTIHLSETYKANATYVKIRNAQSSVGQVLQVFHLSDCYFYSSQTIGQVKFRTLDIALIKILPHLPGAKELMYIFKSFADTLKVLCLLLYIEPIDNVAKQQICKHDLTMLTTF